MELDLKTSLTKTRTFSIDENTIRFDEVSLNTADINGFAYGNTVQENRLMKTTTYIVKFRSSNGQTLQLAFTDTVNSEARSKMKQIVDNVWKYVGHRILTESIHTISIGGQIEVAGILVNKDGFSYKYKPWFRKERTYNIKWTEIEWEIMQPFELFSFQSAVDKKAKGIIGLVGAYNGRVLTSILTELKDNPEMIEYLTANKIYSV